MKSIKRSYQIGIEFSCFFLMCCLFFQNCTQNGKISTTQNSFTSSPNESSTSNTSGESALPDLSVCNGVSCNLNPLTHKEAVTTILLALGDQANNQLVINGGSSQLIAETVIRYTSPVQNPKILVVQDYDIGDEDPEDTVYVKNVLLARYQTQLIIAPKEGLQLKDIEGYDLVWFNNPGHPMSSLVTYQTLLQFKGGLVLQGDDLSNGKDFSIESLTHLKYLDNGTEVTCSGQKYHIDNNSGNQYRVNLDSVKFPSAELSQSSFKYGNDIDQAEVLSSDVEVMALAYGGADDCVESRPAIVRYFKN